MSLYAQSLSIVDWWRQWERSLHFSYNKAIATAQFLCAQSKNDKIVVVTMDFRILNHIPPIHTFLFNGRATHMPMQF